ncbi:hypothetical protein [Dyadobacter sp. MSC1_007]|jgi:hypothetical protein|uniref:hypothetical protein n=1 Tax=Dyadobacter sp. MSC1_007 TaxID=2909264 RepID=UPI00202F6589|nr:hypothetical protein [Dyadobacter sp. MSC1_007]
MGRKINVLQEWYDNGEKISSVFAPPVIGRGVFSRVYTALKLYFGEEYFVISEREDKSIEKHFWIVELLANKNSFECIVALDKIVKLTVYLHTLPRHVVKEFEHLRGDYNDARKVHAENLRNFFYEIYITRLLEQKRILVEKKPEDNGKPLDGVCYLDGKKFIIECTKPAIPKRIEFDVLKRVATEFILLTEKTIKLPPIIVVIDFKGRVTPAYKSHFSAYLIQLRKHLNTAHPGELLNFQVDNEYGSMRTEHFSDERLDKLMNESHGIIFYSNGLVDQPAPNSGINYKFSIEEHEILKHLEAVLKQKKTQHIDSEYAEKIIFIDSETLPEFNFGLFHEPTMFNLDKVTRLYEKLRMDCLVCITIRDYTSGELVVATHLIATERLEKEAQWLVDRLRRDAEFADITYLNL